MSPIVTIYEEPKPYLFAWHDRDDRRIFETLLLENFGAAKTAISYVRWHSAGDDPEDILLWALI